MPHDRSIRLFTDRLVLRATVPADVERAVKIRANHEVARNLVSATIPPDTEKMTNWFAGHAEEWREGTAYRLAITLNGRLIGICDLFGAKRGAVCGGAVRCWAQSRLSFSTRAWRRRAPFAHWLAVPRFPGTDGPHKHRWR